MERISRERFIRLGTALGVGAAAASLAACGGGAGSGGSANSGGGSGGGKSGDKPGGSKAGGDKSGGGKPEGHDHGGKSDEGHDHGGNSGDEKSGGGGKEDSPKQAAPSGGPAIASESEVAPGSAVTFKDAGNPAVLVHLDNGDFVAYSAVCTHQGCTVAYNNGQLVCPCHGSIFDPASGAAVITGPAETPLPEIPVKIQGGDVTKA